MSMHYDGTSIFTFILYLFHLTGNWEKSLRKYMRQHYIYILFHQVLRFSFKKHQQQIMKPELYPVPAHCC